MATNQALAQTLEQIGLKKKEAEVYLALLALESSTAYQIAQHCEVKKPTVYVILEDLRQKGLVLKIPHAKKALFAARDIGEYLAEQRRKLNAVEHIAPQLQTLGGAGRPNVYFFTGLRGCAEALEFKFDAMRGKTFHSFYGSLMGSNPEIMRLYSAWDKRALANEMSFKLIMPEEAKKKYYKDIADLAEAEPETVHIQYLKNYIYPPNISVEIAEDFVRIDDAKNLQVTIVDDKSTAEAFRSIFNIVWEKGV
ncbi:MAG: helix-turn-helix domain-containing protein [Patescibacteria group bacterium]